MADASTVTRREGGGGGNLFRSIGGPLMAVADVYARGWTNIA